MSKSDLLAASPTKTGASAEVLNAKETLIANYHPAPETLRSQSGVDLTENLRFYVGYDLLMISDVVRPADQIDLTINRSQIPNNAGPQPLVGVARPSVPFRGSFFSAQGLNLGLEWRY